MTLTPLVRPCMGNFPPQNFRMRKCVSSEDTKNEVAWDWICRKNSLFLAKEVDAEVKKTEYKLPRFLLLIFYFQKLNHELHLVFESKK